MENWTDHTHCLYLEEIAGCLKKHMEWSFIQIVVRTVAVIQEGAQMCTQAKKEQSLWKRTAVPASCRAEPGTEAAGQLNYSSGQFCKVLVLH